MVLTLEALLVIAASCAPGVAPETVAAIARTESAFNTLIIHDNTTKQSHHPGDKASAVTLAQDLLMAGHSVDLGLMQINAANLNWLGLPIDDAFEPCPSIKAGATVLTAYSRYNTGDPAKGFGNGYVRRVRAAEAENKGEKPPTQSRHPEPLLADTLGKVAEEASPNWNVFGGSGDSSASFIITSKGQTP
jgi:type IV secretion system protein VirB1